MQGQTYIADIRAHADPLRRPLMFSAAAHVALAVAAIAATVICGIGESWGSGGGGGGAASVRLVSSASIPLPTPEVSTENRHATEEKALNYPEPAPKVKAPTPKVDDPKAIDLPTKNAKIADPKKQPPKKEEPEKQRNPLATTGQANPTLTAMARNRPPNANPMGNEIPNGAGGQVPGPFGATIQSNNGSGGVGMSGDFGNKFGWYVESVSKRISQNWLQASIDPSVRVAPRALVTFRIMRDGRIVNAELAQPSNIPTLDRSVLRAVYDSSPLSPLPPGFSGSSVDASFWFDLKR